MKRLFTQIFRFVGISGIGWLIDFGIYTVLTTFAGVPVTAANMISSFPAITLVFIVSTRKIFDRGGRIPVPVMYALYLAYQLILVFAVSKIAGYLALWIAGLYAGRLAGISKILAKIIITPITMTANFVVMKLMTEKK